MVTITAEGLGKRFVREWIFKDFDYTFSSGNIYAITGNNGSGKSTLLKVISASLPNTSGKIVFERDQKQIHANDIFRSISLAAPYLDLVEDFTLAEAISFHTQLKPLNSAYATSNLPKLMQLSGQEGKYIRDFSSGMKQRVKLGLALTSASPVLILDEPTSNLDKNGKHWFYSLLKEVRSNKLILLASNESEEISLTQNIITLADYKP